MKNMKKSYILHVYKFHTDKAQPNKVAKINQK